MKSKQGQGQNFPVPEFYKLELWPQSEEVITSASFFSLQITNSCRKPNEQKVGIPGVSVVKNLPARAGDIDQDWIPDPGRSHRLWSN